MWSGSPVSSNLRVEVCRFIPSFAAHAAVALEADPHQIRSRKPAEYLMKLPEKRKVKAKQELQQAIPAEPQVVAQGTETTNSNGE